MKRLKKPEHLAWRARALERDKGCVICNNNITRYCNVHHIIPSEFHKYEYDDDNAICLCPTHHTLGKMSAHKNPIWFYEWMLRNRPILLSIALRRLAEL